MWFYRCIVTYIILSWPKITFGFFVRWHDLNELFGQPHIFNIYVCVCVCFNHWKRDISNVGGSVNNINLREGIARIIPPSKEDACYLSSPFPFSYVPNLEARLPFHLIFKLAGQRKLGELRVQRTSQCCPVLFQRVLLWGGRRLGGVSFHTFGRLQEKGLGTCNPLRERRVRKESTNNDSS